MLKLSIGLTICMALVNSANADMNKRYRKIDADITRASALVGVPSNLMIAICWHESRYKEHMSEKPDGHTPSYGICQVKLETAQHMDEVYNNKVPATIKALHDPYVNALYAAKYLKYQLKRYSNWRKAVAAYNRGFYDSKNPNIKYLTKVETSFLEKGLDPAIIFEEAQWKNQD